MQESTAARKQATESPRAPKGTTWPRPARTHPPVLRRGRRQGGGRGGAGRRRRRSRAPARLRRRRAHLGRVGPRRLPGPPRHRRPPVDGDPVGPASPPATLARERAWSRPPASRLPGTGAGHQRASRPRVPPAAGTNLAERMITDMPALPACWATSAASTPRCTHRSAAAGPETGGAAVPPRPSRRSTTTPPCRGAPAGWLDANAHCRACRRCATASSTPPTSCGTATTSPACRSTGPPPRWRRPSTTSATLVGFWSTALYGNAVQRRMLKTVGTRWPPPTWPATGRRRPRARRRPAALLAGRTCTAWRRPSTAGCAGAPWDTSAHAHPHLLAARRRPPVPPGGGI